MSSFKWSNEYRRIGKELEDIGAALAGWRESILRCSLMNYSNFSSYIFIEEENFSVHPLYWI
jgi:hypothetical protein